MAWNKYYVVVTNQTQKMQPEEVVSLLGLFGYSPIGNASFYQTNKSEDLFIGYYEDKLVIANPEVSCAFFVSTQTELEERFVQAFPNAEIAAFIENSTVSAFGFAIIQNGERIRMKDGCDGEYYNDIGAALPEELEILSEQIFDPEEIEWMRMDMDEDAIQDSINFEASWRVPSRISKRYFGDIIDNLADEKLVMRHFKKM